MNIHAAVMADSGGLTKGAMVGLGVGAFALAALFAFMAAKPRGTWWALSSWQFRNPEANEPSDVVYGIGSFVYGVIALGLVIVAIWLFAAEAPADRAERQDRESADCEQILDQFQRAVDWNDRRLANRSGVTSLGRELGVDLEFDSLGSGSDTVRVSQDGEFLFLLGANYSGGCD